MDINLLDYSSNFSDTTGSLWFSSKDEAANLNNDIGIQTSIRLKYYEKHFPATNNANGILKNTTIAVPLISNLSNFWRTLEMPLSNSKIELKLKRAKYCVLSAAGNDNIDDNPNNIIFLIRDTKLHVPVVTLSVKHNQQPSNLLHKESERSVYWNEKQK